MVPPVTEPVAARFTEPLLHPVTVLLDAALGGSPAVADVVAPVFQVAWRLLGLLLAL